ncbi:MAG: aminomethyl-transferring glycine dehydrogenase subunit GcvPA [Sulfolobaceae archaeon]
MNSHPWLPNLKIINEMLKKIGIEDIEELFKDVPQEIRLKDVYKIPYKTPLSEYEIIYKMKKLEEKNLKLKYPPFLGAGACPHIIPYVVKFVISRSEFYTAYTPYQPEISQGLLQAIFEYQSLIAELFEMDVVNASHYDWGSALAEAVFMANRINGRKYILIAENINPLHKEVLKTWIYGKDLKIIEIPYSRESGKIDIEKAIEILNKYEISAVYFQQPNYFGVVETEIESLVEYAKRKKVITIAGVKPLSLGLLKPPGEYDIDIAVGDGQELGLPLNFGGPYLGILAVKWDANLIKQMPGRIVGLTRDIEGKIGYTLILQSREQFIRREKATSNITTNETLMAIAAAVFLALLGREGIRRIAEEIYYRSHYAEKRIVSQGAIRKFNSEFFEEFLLQFPIEYDKIHKHLISRRIHGGYKINQKEALFCVTEIHTKEMIDELAESIGEVLK